MFRRLSNSWELTKASYQVLRSDRQLLIFPLISSLLTLIVLATFIVPLIPYFMWIGSHSSASAPHEFASSAHSYAASSRSYHYESHTSATMGHSPLYYVWAFSFYLCQYFVIFFANTALISAAIIRLRGGTPTVADGFKVAWSRKGSILGYAFIAATVGMILKSIQERVGFLGKIVTSILGVAWTVATFLVAPVLVMENPGAVGAVKRSTALLKQTWGEQVIGTVGISAIFGWMFLGVMLVFGGFAMAAAVAESFALAITLLVLMVLAILALALIQSALTGIYTAAVYLYAADGFTPGAFDAEMIRGAFRTKGI